MGLLTLVGLWFAYYVPQRLRRRAELGQARVDDRFSGALRVLAVSREDTVRTRGHGAGGSSTQSLLTGPMPTVVARTRKDSTGVGRMERPMNAGARDSVRGDDRVAARERRAAAARRRLVLTMVLLVAAVAAWTGATAGPVPVAVPLVLTLAFGGVLALGRRAVVAGQRADQAERTRARARVDRAMSAPRQRQSVITGRAVHGSQTQTELISSREITRRASAMTPASQAGLDDAVEEAHDAPVEVSAPTDAVVVQASLVRTSDIETRDDVACGVEDVEDMADSGELAGFSLPRPAYTLKAPAARREPAPLRDEDVTTPANAAERAHAAQQPEASSEPVTGEFANLDRILDRRRAAGE